MSDAFDFERRYPALYQRVEVPPDGPAGMPARYRDRVLVDTLHDGQAIPSEFRLDEAGRPRVDLDALWTRYVAERDWGANLVARKLAAALGLGAYYRVTVARVLLDFNRFPGSTPWNNHDPLERLAINTPFAGALDHPQKMRLLHRVYDGISAEVEEVLPNKLIKLAVHTYDEENANETQRPHVSLITQTAHFQAESCMRYGVFDPMYPDVLGESTCSRVLRDRISLGLERAGIRVGHNQPYLLPEGSLEVRCQVWYYFQFLRQRFELLRPETREDPAFQWVWSMLTNTNLRLARAEALRSYLHRYRRVRAGRLAEYQAAERAYVDVRQFQRSTDVVRRYRQSPARPSSLTFEVRKDLVCRRDADGRPTPPGAEQEENAEQIARTIAQAIVTWLETDRPATSQVG